jgi:hypothetical protein
MSSSPSPRSVLSAVIGALTDTPQTPGQIAARARVRRYRNARRPGCVVESGVEAFLGTAQVEGTAVPVRDTRHGETLWVRAQVAQEVTR